ncbi:dUTP pyrophosphatase [Clostridiales Family XIII bacterium PM5-7]
MKEEKKIVKFAKLHKDAVIPSKRDEDGGYDIYPAFDKLHILLKPGETAMIPTGICSSFDSDYVFILKERGSTGTKGIGQRSGVIDSGYRGEWLVPITNHSDGYLLIGKLEGDVLTEAAICGKQCIVHPYHKAIAQAILVPVPKVDIMEVSKEEIQSEASERGDGKLGSSGK